MGGVTTAAQHRFVSHRTELVEQRNSGSTTTADLPDIMVVDVRSAKIRVARICNASAPPGAAGICTSVVGCARHVAPTCTVADMRRWQQLLPKAMTQTLIDLMHRGHLDVACTIQALYIGIRQALSYKSPSAHMMLTRALSRAVCEAHTVCIPMQTPTNHPHVAELYAPVRPEGKPLSATTK
jgi:hypothetical protein